MGFKILNKSPKFGPCSAFKSAPRKMLEVFIVRPVVAPATGETQEHDTPVPRAWPVGHMHGGRDGSVTERDVTAAVRR